MAKGRGRSKVAERLCIPVGARVFAPSQQRTTTFINTVTTLLLSALPYPLTMSAPETPPPSDVATPPPSDEAAQGDSDGITEDSFESCA